MGVSVVLMNSVTLTSGVKASSSLLLSGNSLTLDFLLVTSAGPSTVTYYLEFSEDNKVWYREVAEEDASKGVVLMPKVVRTFSDNNSTNLADGTHLVSCQFTRRAQFARVQAAVAVGACKMSLSAPFGQLGV
jgi:hypothetical protein